MTSENLEALRREVRGWLRENLPKGWGTPEYVPPIRYSRESHELGREWTKKMYDVGYTGFNYPKEYGGIERPREEVAVIYEEMGRTGTPGGPLSLGLLVAAPAILVHGEEWQKKRFIPKILSGEESWCEGFSEPDAGSDLANVQTTAVRDGDEWVVNGQKVWTSMWEFADWGLLVAKTEPDAPRHRNLSYFLFDTSTPGFSRRPLVQMSGEAEFGEMFFDDMRVPHKNMMDEQGRGWYVAMTALMAERSFGGTGFSGGMAAMGGLGTSDLLGANALVELAKNTKRYGKSVWEESAFRQRIMQTAIELEAMRWSGTRMAAKMMKGTPIGNEASVLKNFQAEMRQRRGDLTCEILGAYSQMVRGSTRAVDEGDHVYNMLRARGATIEMGTSEINRNIIAERILGLPR
ncbi:MAG: acyl-CoA dehydrogenase family protein [Dehalococcoidales bacterium]|nr:MAG: acyl-CoA dehydrogenase family protein [Dehalococcoidales bacterium]